MKIPFSIKYRPQIESGEYKVEIGRDDPWPARIVCWDFDGNNLIVAVRNPNDREEGLIYSIDGKHKAICPKIDSDLFIITPEPEMSEFEERIFKLLRQYKECDIPLTPENIKAEASMLWPDLEKYFFDLYGKEGEGDSALRSFYYRGFEDGKAEALKDLPRWKPAAKAYDGDRLPRMDWPLNRLVDRFGEGIFYLDIGELHKLPRFKEDEK